MSDLERNAPYAIRPRYLPSQVSTSRTERARTGRCCGAASLDAWLEFGHRDDWHKPLSQRARAASSQNASDYRTFTKLYDAGAFDVPG